MLGSVGLFFLKRILLLTVLEMSPAGGRLPWTGDFFEKQFPSTGGNAAPLLVKMQVCLFVVTLSQWSFLPIILPIRPWMAVVMLVLLFQVRFILDCWVKALISPFLAQLRFKRGIVQHLASQIVLIPVFLASWVLPLVHHAVFYFCLFILAFVAVVCQSGFGPFKFSMTVQCDGEDGPIPQKVLIFDQWIRLIQLTFSMALVLVLSRPEVYAFCHMNWQTWIHFGGELAVLLLFCLVSFPFLPSLRTDQYQRLFCRFLGPLAGSLLWVLILAKFFRG